MFLHAGSEDFSSGWAGAQADLSLRWAHRSFCWFCHAAAHIALDHFLVTRPKFLRVAKWFVSEIFFFSPT